MPVNHIKQLTRLCALALAILALLYALNLLLQTVPHEHFDSCAPLTRTGALSFSSAHSLPTSKPPPPAISEPSHRTTPAAALTSPLRLKIFVYNLPSTFTTDLLPRHVNIFRDSASNIQLLHDGGTEVLFHKFLLQNRTGVLTSDPNAAHLFFVPFYASASDNAASLARKGLLRQLHEHHLIYWNRCGGCDHVFALGRHYSQRTAFGTNSHTLTTSSSSILLLFEVTNTPQEEMLRKPWTFARNILIPWPRLTSGSQSLQALRVSAGSARPNEFALIGSGITSARRLLARELKNWTVSGAHVQLFCRDSRKNAYQAMRSANSTYGNGDWSVPDVYARSDFCFCPRGDSRSDTRLFDAIRALCIPVVVNNNLRVLPFEQTIPYLAFTIFAKVSTASDVQLLLNRLHAIPQEQRKRMRSRMAEHASKLTYDEQEAPNAFDATMGELEQRAGMLAQARRVLRNSDERFGWVCKVHTAMC